MTRGAVAVVFIVLIMALAGCTDGDPDESEPGPPAPGTIEGRVLDGLGLPIEAAHVALAFSTSATTTDASGAFRIIDVEPGPVAVVATKSGHSAQTLRGLLETGGRLGFEFQLRAAPRLDPRHLTTSYDGILACSLPLAIGCGPAAPQVVAPHHIAVVDGLSGMLIELEWAPPGPGLATTLRMEAAAATSIACGEPYAHAVGESVLRLVVAEGFPIAGGHQCLLVWPATEAVVQQVYTLHVTLFYHTPIPEGFSALE